MRRFIISLVLLTGIITLAVYSKVYIDNNANEMISLIENIKKEVEEENFNEGKIYGNNLSELWSDFCMRRTFIIDTQHVLEITDAITRINTLLEKEDDELIIECNVALSHLKLYKNKNSAIFEYIL